MGDDVAAEAWGLPQIAYTPGGSSDDGDETI